MLLCFTDWFTCVLSSRWREPSSRRCHHSFSVAQPVLFLHSLIYLTPVWCIFHKKCARTRSLLKRYPEVLSSCPWLLLGQVSCASTVLSPGGRGVGGAACSEEKVRGKEGKGCDGCQVVSNQAFFRGKKDGEGCRIAEECVTVV